MSDSFHGSLKLIMENEAITESLMQLLWKEQEKAFTSQKGGMHWHPMFMRFAILIHSHGTSAYRTLRKKGALRLPGVYLVCLWD